MMEAMAEIPAGRIPMIFCRPPCSASEVMLLSPEVIDLFGIALIVAFFIVPDAPPSGVVGL